MIDILPYPRLSSEKPEEQITELVNYLIQFKEDLEFALRNISTDNLSPELIKKLNDLGAKIDNSNLAREEELAQLNSGNTTL